MLIDNQHDLEEACAQFSAEPYITVDTEFMRDRTYWAKLCLVQIGGEHRAVAIDALAEGIDLTPVLALLSDPSLLKVMHAARQDIEIFYKMMGDRLPVAIFDTQIAAMFCGLGDDIGYDNLVQQLTGQKIDKTSRFTDWARRPLSDSQLQYALGDVTHLRNAYIKLIAKLEEQGRRKWSEEETKRLLLEEQIYRTEPDEAWHRLKLRSREPRFIAAVQMIAAIRESYAQEKNVPRNRILKDDILMQIAAQRPESIEALRDIPRVSIDRTVSGLITDAMAKLAQRDQGDLPSPPAQRRPPPGIGPMTELLRVLLRQCAESQGVAQKVIATSSDLEAIAKDDTADVAALEGWRREMFGEQALALKNGQLSLSARDGKVVLIDDGELDDHDISPSREKS